MIAAGDIVEAKRAAGLGGYELATVVEVCGQRAVVVRFRRDGVTSTVSASRVRQNRASVALPGARTYARPFEAVKRLPGASRTAAEVVTFVRERVPSLVRAVELERVPGKATRPIRSVAYLEHVRAMPCCACSASGPSDPHHYGPRGMGQKADDLRAVPLCRRCHDMFHARGHVPPDAGAENPTAATRERLLAVQVDALVSWHRR